MTMTNWSIPRVWVLTVVALTGTASDRASLAVSEQEADIKVAIDDGITHEVKPYELRHVAGSNAVVGLLFTPYVRIARFARERHLAGKTVSPEEVPQHLSEPVVHVAMRKPQATPDVPNVPIAIAAIFGPLDRPPPSEIAYFIPRVPPLSPPLRVETTDSAKRVMGAVTFHDLAGVAVFPVSSVQRPFVEFCAYREFYLPDDPHPSYDVVAGWVAGPLR